jgi:Uma2 family endonuclease
VRGPDLAFVSAERIRDNPPPRRGFWELAPDLAVEIVSPEDEEKDLREKVDDYLRAGVRLVWLIDPRARRARVYRPGAEVQTVEAGGSLDGGDVLPEFTIPVAAFWEDDLQTW